MRRLLLGCGYLGSRVLSRWQAEPGETFVTTRSAERAEELAKFKCQPIVTDVTSMSVDLPDVDVVVYSVGMDRSAGHSMRSVYVDGLARTLAHLPKPKVFIYISSTGVLGDADGAWLDESSAPAPTDESGRICLEAETLLRQFANTHGWRVYILRFAGIYGPGRVPLQQDVADRKIVRSNPDAWLNLIHVDDGAQAVQMVEQLHVPAANASDETDPNPGSPGAMDARTEVIHVCDGTPVQRGDFYRYLADLLQAPEPTFDASQATRHRGNRRLSNQKLRRLGFTPRYPDYQTGLRAILMGDNQ